MTKNEFQRTIANNTTTVLSGILSDNIAFAGVGGDSDLAYWDKGIEIEKLIKSYSSAEITNDQMNIQLQRNIKEVAINLFRHHLNLTDFTNRHEQEILQVFDYPKYSNEGQITLDNNDFSIIDRHITFFEKNFKDDEKLKPFILTYKENKKPSNKKVDANGQLQCVHHIRFLKLYLELICLQKLQLSGQNKQNQYSSAQQEICIEYCTQPKDLMVYMSNILQALNNSNQVNALGNYVVLESLQRKLKKELEEQYTYEIIARNQLIIKKT